MPGRKIRIAIIGFGRIGRSLLRLVMSPAFDDFEVAFINDVADLDTLAYLFKYDSVFGPYHGTVDASDNALNVDGTVIRFHQRNDISNLDLTGIDIVLECSGQAVTREIAERVLKAGAGRVLLSGPSKSADKTVVVGANEDQLAHHRIVSNASCTTNALAPLLKILDDNFGVESGHMTTVHCYTGSQPTVDLPRASPERSRAAALSMVPTTTSAAELIGDVLPHLAGRVEARALRVPTASVSCIDLAVDLNSRPTEAQVNAALVAASGDVIGCVSEPVVSTDMRARPQSIVMATRETSVSIGGLVRVFGWYDNEWGFSNRMLDVARLMS